MIPYNQEPLSYIDCDGRKIASFMAEGSGHIDHGTVRSFGEEWSKFSTFSDKDIKTAGDQYFDIIDDNMINSSAVVLDLGCGTGRWSRYIADRVKFIEAIDPSIAVLSAAKLTADKPNIRVTQAGVDNIPFADGSFDFILCLGVLHHLPGTAEAMAKAVKKLRMKGNFLVYLYYDLDNRGMLYKTLFGASDLLRRSISKLPGALKRGVCDVIAAVVYMPFVLAARGLRLAGGNAWKAVPLSYYADKSFGIIRNDSLDRFGTPLEQRFSKKEISEMMSDAGLGDIVFSPSAPFWHAVGTRIR
jgi:SAM-dependent methyltransferase